MSRTLRLKRMAMCSNCATDKRLRHERIWHDKPQVFGHVRYPTCGDCTKAWKKWGWIPEHHNRQTSGAARGKKLDERRCRRHMEKIQIRKGDDVDPRAWHDWLD